MVVNINRTNLSGRIIFLNNGQQLDRAKSSILHIRKIYGGKSLCKNNGRSDNLSKATRIRKTPARMTAYACGRACRQVAYAAGRDSPPTPTPCLRQGDLPHDNAARGLLRRRLPLPSATRHGSARLLRAIRPGRPVLLPPCCWSMHLPRTDSTRNAPLNLFF